MANKNFNVYCNSRIEWWDDDEENAYIRVQNGNLQFYIPTFNATTAYGFRNLCRKNVRVYAGGGKYFLSAGNKTYTLFPASYTSLAGRPYDGVDISTFARGDDLMLMDEIVKKKPTYWMNCGQQVDLYAGNSFYTTICWINTGWHLSGNMCEGKHYKRMDCNISGSTTITVQNATTNIWGWLLGRTGTVKRTYYTNMNIGNNWYSPIYCYEMYRKFCAQFEEYTLKLKIAQRRYGVFASIYGVASSLLAIFSHINRGMATPFPLLICWNDLSAIYTRNVATFYYPGMWLYLKENRTGEVLASTYFYPKVWKYYPYSFSRRFWW